MISSELNFTSAQNLKRWIPVDNLMPEQKESSFAKHYGTPLWKDGIMWQKASANVLVTAEYNTGERIVFPCSTKDGAWNKLQIPLISKFKRVVAWMPYPDAYEDDR